MASWPCRSRSIFSSSACCRKLYFLPVILSVTLLPKNRPRFSKFETDPGLRQLYRTAWLLGVGMMLASMFVATVDSTGIWRRLSSSASCSYLVGSSCFCCGNWMRKWRLAQYPRVSKTHCSTECHWCTGEYYSEFAVDTSTWIYWGRPSNIFLISRQCLSCRCFSKGNPD